MKKEIGWHDNKWIALDEINLSIKNRGLKFSDGIFETILIKENRPILLHDHIIRLNQSLLILNYKFKLDYKFIEEIIHKGIEKLYLREGEYGSIRINYSRGKNKDRNIKIVNESNRFDPINLWLEFYSIKINFDPISVIISKNERRNEFSALSRCKTFSYLQSIQALMEANKNNFDDAIILNTNNELCCGTSFNLLIKRNNTWLTPRKESGCLPGIMIGKLLKLKLIKEEYLTTDFDENDILIAINSLSCRQIKKINDLKFKNYFDPNYFWETLFI